VIAVAAARVFCDNEDNINKQEATDKLESCRTVEREKERKRKGEGSWRFVVFYLRSVR